MKKIPIFEIEYIWDNKTSLTEISHKKIADKILQTLKEKNLYENNLYFRGFEARRIKKALRYGTDKYPYLETIDAAKEVDKRKHGNGFDIIAAVDYGLGHAFDMYNSIKHKVLNKLFGCKRMRFAVSVYRKEDLKPTFDETVYNLQKDAFPLTIFEVSI